VATGEFLREGSTLKSGRFLATELKSGGCEEGEAFLSVDFARPFFGGETGLDALWRLALAGLYLLILADF